MASHADAATVSSPADLSNTSLDMSSSSPSQAQGQTDRVEMSHLSSQPQSAPQPRVNSPISTATADAAPSAATSSEPPTSITHDTPTAPILDGAYDGAYIPAPPPEPESAPQVAPNRERSKSEAIGPSTEDNPAATSKILATSAEAGPAVLLTLILLNGARHPYKIDAKYLKKRNVAGTAREDTEVDPFAISVYTLKELIWRDWREEWDPRPMNPVAIRLIHFGKLLDDKQTLKDTKFHPTNPNVVHMTVRPQEFLDEDENQKGGKSSSSRGLARGGDDGRAAGCCRCTIM